MRRDCVVLPPSGQRPPGRDRFGRWALGRRRKTPPVPGGVGGGELSAPGPSTPRLSCLVAHMTDVSCPDKHPVPPASDCAVPVSFPRDGTVRVAWVDGVSVPPCYGLPPLCRPRDCRRVRIRRPEGLDTVFLDSRRPPPVVLAPKDSHEGNTQTSTRFPGSWGRVRAGLRVPGGATDARPLEQWWQEPG